MPTYEYQCQACGHHHEEFQKISDAPITECPACHQPSLSKLVSAASFQLKGTGWYATDFKDKGKPKPAATTQETKQETQDKPTDKPAKPTDDSSSSTG